MNVSKEIQPRWKEKNGKKLVVFTVIIFLIITAIVFFAVLNLSRIMRIKQMDESLNELPNIIENHLNELYVHSRIYDEDLTTRVELGLKLYKEANGLSEVEKLEQIRDTVTADSISLLDGQRELLFTTGFVSSEEKFHARIKELKPNTPYVDYYPVLSESGEITGKYAGEGFLLVPVPGNTDRSLVCEFFCGNLLDAYQESEDWTEIFERILSWGEAVAFAKVGDKLTGHPLDDFTNNQLLQLKEELTKVFQSDFSKWKTWNGRPVELITLLGKRYLAAWMQYPQADSEILLTVPLRDVIGNGIFIAVTISVTIGLGLVLLQIYIYRKLMREKIENKVDNVSRETLWRLTWPGLLVFLAIFIIFSSMLLVLENQTKAAILAGSRRVSLQNEIDQRKTQEEAIRRNFVDTYRARAQMLAAFLMENPDYQTRSGLQELNRIAKTDYLMRFDSTGKELVSSNSYTGFSIDTNLSEEYRAVLMGYPYIVVGPAADRYTGEMQIGTAIQMTDKEGQPDGFLLAVYDAGDMTAEIKQMSYEYAVNNFVVQEGHVAAAISDETGRFIAHSNPKIIGMKAIYSLEDYEPDRNFEGFTYYNGKAVYVSSSSADEKTLLFAMPVNENSYRQAHIPLAGVVILLILVLLYYPIAGVLLMREMEERKDITSDTDTRNPIMVFPDGYSVCLTVLAIFALLACYNGWWTSFDYVFSGQWSKGVHLFSIWAALFILAVTLCIEFLIRIVLKKIESRLSLKSKTVTRLANSLITYTAGIFLIFCILGMFGVNTTALLASAGVISIAVGMGAQSMAADLLAGFFMMVEGSVHVGDYVKAGDKKVMGHVTDMGIRTTEITDDEGNVTILSNSKVTPVCNMTPKHQKLEENNKLEKETKE